ncbi:MAG: hypothetical protein ACMG6E_07365 [Candidatus Roizmanbacteria bacterium]
MKPAIDALYDKKKEIRGELIKYKEQIAEKETEIEAVRKQFEDAKSLRADLQEQIDKFEEQYQQKKEELNKLYEKKNLDKEAYYQAKLEYEIESDEIYHADWIAKEKARIVERDEYKKRQAEERKQQMQDRPNPYEKEIDTCDHVIAYLNRKKIQMGLGDEKEATIRDVEKTLLSQYAKEDVQKKVNDGKLERALTKEDKEKEAMIQVGRQKKGKKPKKEKANFAVQEAFDIDISVINKFGFLKVSPPLSGEDLDVKIKEVLELKTKFYDDGEKRLKDEGEMDYDQVEEAKLDDDDQERAGGDHFRGGRGGRGGRGRGDRNDNRGGRGGHRGGADGGRERGKYHDKDDEIDDEDVKYEEEQRQKKLKEKKPQKKENLNMDVNSYPTL